MKFWTVQKTAVVNTVNKFGGFSPDFNKSDYIEINPDLKSLYDVILSSFNQVNNVMFSGLIFSFMKSDDKNIYQIPDIYSFYDLIKEKKPVIKSLWENLSSKDTVILELDYSENFNPIYIDINDFQFLMPPIMIMPPYTDKDIQYLLEDIQNGIIRPSVFPSGLIQAHLPYIKSENITNIYPMFKLN
ncbi:MAG: hypothetical protein ACI4K5_00755 [Ruminococcus sp.]